VTKLGTCDDLLRGGLEDFAGLLNIAKEPSHARKTTVRGALYESQIMIGLGLVAF
jgi:hypothetical protein